MKMAGIFRLNGYMMKLESTKKVTVRDVVIGGAAVAVCVPVVATGRADLLADAAGLLSLKPDLIEWRADAQTDLLSLDRHLETLASLSRVISPVPLIYTLRSAVEGGLQQMAQTTRKDLIVAAILSGLPDIVDIELSNEPAFIEEVLDAAVKADVRVILSFHDFEKTPDRKVILDRLMRSQALGADIAKAAVMPKNQKDLLTLLEVTLEAREKLEIPLITISMAELGLISRIAGGFFGSDVTFAAGKQVSAPGQISIGELRKAMSVIENRDRDIGC